MVPVRATRYPSAAVPGAPGSPASGGCRLWAPSSLSRMVGSPSARHFCSAKRTELPPDADAAVSGIGHEHAELARSLVEALHADAARDLAAEPGHGDLAGPDELGDFLGRCAGRAVDPQPLLGPAVDLVRQIGEPPHELGVVACGSRKQLDLDRGRRFGHVIQLPGVPRIFTFLPAPAPVWSRATDGPSSLHLGEELRRGAPSCEWSRSGTRAASRTSTAGCRRPSTRGARSR